MHQTLLDVARQLITIYIRRLLIASVIILFKCLQDTGGPSLHDSLVANACTTITQELGRGYLNVCLFAYTSYITFISCT